MLSNYLIEFIALSHCYDNNPESSRHKCWLGTTLELQRVALKDTVGLGLRGPARFCKRGSGSAQAAQVAGGLTIAPSRQKRTDLITTDKDLSSFLLVIADNR